MRSRYFKDLESGLKAHVVLVQLRTACLASFDPELGDIEEVTCGNRMCLALQEALEEAGMSEPQDALGLRIDCCLSAHSHVGMYVRTPCTGSIREALAERAKFLRARASG